MTDTMRTNELLLMLPAAEGKALWKVDLSPDGSITQLDAEEAAGRGFGRGMMVGAPDASAEGDAYKLDLTQLARRVQKWVDAPRSSARPAPGGSVQAGPHDVVVPVRTARGTDLRVVQMDVETTPRADGSGTDVLRMTPVGVAAISDGPSHEAIMTFFHTGSCLTYLQQTTFPIGATCYLLNLLALDDVDPDAQT